MRTSVIYLLYRIIQTAALPLLILYVLRRGLREPKYLEHLPERFGWLSFPRTPSGGFWLHAVSVGEVLSSVELVRNLASQGPVWVSCSTLSGRDAAEAKLASLVDGIFYAPYDYVWAVRAVLRKLRPSAVIVLETEIWPNLYRECKRAGCGLLIANGRISDKTERTYRSMRWFFSSVLSHPDMILAQSEEDVERYIESGAPARSVRYGGNLKYDFDAKSNPVAEDLATWIREPLWIAASTVAPEYEGDVDEDDAVISSFIELRRSFPALNLIVAPRKPERFDIVADKLVQSGVPFARRTALHPAPVLLLDSIGDLGGLFPFATVVFMGGTLADRGGHNILEPASCGKPVVVGPHLENFGAIYRHFTAARAFREIAGPSELTGAIADLLHDPSDVGERARYAAEAERGATADALNASSLLRARSIPKAIGFGPVKPLAYLLSRLWLLGGRLKRAMTNTRKLQTTVVSVGGIAMGGTGKTPFVVQVTQELVKRGLRVGILTRGYKRKLSREVVLDGHADAPVDLTGDEAQILLRSGAACVGLGSDRYTVGVKMEREFKPDIIVLDDGFQHARLHRDLDIVLLDGLDPLAGGVFPVGRLRESPNALSRADVIVVTRAENRTHEFMEAFVRSHNLSADLFLSEVQPVEWTPPLGTTNVAAFCGLANPATFERTLRGLGIVPVWFRQFPDHHRYTSEEIIELGQEAEQAGAFALVTTEKDTMNLPPDRGIEMPIHWLRIETQVDRALIDRIVTRR